MSTLALLFFTALWIVPSLFILPAAKRTVLFLSPSSKQNTSITSPLAPALGVAFFLVLFSLIARVVPSYAVSTILALFVILFLGRLSKTFFPDNDFRIQASDFVPFLVLFGTHMLFWIPRIWFSDIHYDPNFYGAEKLFNLSLQQSFSYGTQYPPQSLWLAGEPESYYILPRVLPGLATHFAISFAEMKAQVAGIFFHLSDTFYNALAVVTLGGCANIFLSKFLPRGKLRSSVVAAVAIFPFLAAPARLFSQLLFTPFDFWSLSRIIPYTINEYPFWNYLFADNHAHNNAAFLDIVVTFLLLSLLQNALSLSRQQSIFAGIVTGISFTALAMSQSGSAFIAAVVFLIPTIGMIIRHFQRKNLLTYLEPFAWTLLTTLATLLPDYLARQQPKVLWHWVPPSLASSALDFLNVSFSFSLVLVFVLFLSQKPFQAMKATCRYPLFQGIVALVFVTWILGYPAVAITGAALLVFGSTMVSAQNPNRSLAICVLAGASLLTIFPEIIGINFNMGANYIRFNTTFKFLYTSFFTLPLMLLFVLTLEPIKHLPTRKTRFVTITLGTFCLALFTAQMFALHNRTKHPPSVGGASGLDFLPRNRFFDAAIIGFLNSLPSNVVIAEECGMPPKPASYSVAGRISAYSGRPSVCGWGMHSFLHHEVFRSKPRQGQPVWNHLLSIDEAFTSLLNGPRVNNVEQNTFNHNDTQTLLKAGATHFIFGEYEKERHPTSSLTQLAKAINGTVVFDIDGFGVIALPSRETLAP